MVFTWHELCHGGRSDGRGNGDMLEWELELVTPDGPFGGYLT